MWGKIKHFGRSEKGTVLVMVALAMVAFTGFTALVTDVGLLYLNRTRLVNAMDSAVLAGAQELPQNPGMALQMAVDYAGRNGINSADCMFTVAEDNKSISGTAAQEVNLFFARVFGFETGNVNASAAARVAPVTGARGVAPFGVIEDDFEFGQIIILKEGAGDPRHKGWFGALQLDVHGACHYRENIIDGHDGIIKIGDVISTEAGNMSGPTQEGVNQRILACHHVPQCTPACFEPGCPRIIIVPIVNLVDVNPAGHTFTVRVVGFGAFLLSGYVGSGNENEVAGAFIRYVSPQEIDSSGEDFGLYGSELYE